MWLTWVVTLSCCISTEILTGAMLQSAVVKYIQLAGLHGRIAVVNPSFVGGDHIHCVSSSICDTAVFGSRSLSIACLGISSTGPRVFVVSLLSDCLTLLVPEATTESVALLSTMHLIACVCMVCRL